MRISVVIPSYNEEERLPDTLRAVTSFPGIDEVIVVCDGSVDRTAEVARSFEGVIVISEPVNRGKGCAVRKGMLSAKGDVIVYFDADLSTPLEEMPKLIKAVRGGADLAIGSRYAPGSVIYGRTIIKYIMGKTFAFLTRLATGLSYFDTQCGFKAFKRPAAVEIFSRSQVDDYAFDIETLLLARAFSLRVAEVAVRWHDKPGSKVRPLGDGYRMLSTLIRLRRMVVEV